MLEYPIPNAGKTLVFAEHVHARTTGEQPGRCYRLRFHVGSHLAHVMARVAADDHGFHLELR